ncbi:phosphoribosylformylglycinamidine synthase subunit PurQ [Nanoarchaeota archaeon]
MLGLQTKTGRPGIDLKPNEEPTPIRSRYTQKPKVLIPTGIGINSHEELGYVFRLAGADVDYRHINSMIDDPSILDQYQGLGLPGGFMMGDQLGAGQSGANRIRKSGLRDKLKEKLEDSNVPIYAVCNFLQVLAKLDLFDDLPVGTLKNDSGKHETGYWDVKVNPDNDTVWLKYLKDTKEPIFAPISHGEGRIYVPKRGLEGVMSDKMVALTYTRGHMAKYLESSRGEQYNPNGSVDDIAGFGWKNNLVLFPHFERLHHDFQRPDRAQLQQEGRHTGAEYNPTTLMFRAAVDFMKGDIK